LVRAEFMDWQREVLEVAGEVDPTTGLLAYPTVGVSVGRQEGKSTLTDAVAYLRSLARRHQRGAYVCQDRSIAADRLLELASGPAARYVADVRRSNGKERIRWTNGSRWEIRAGTGKAGRGPSLDTVMVDEAALLPFAVLDALGPTQAARPDPQLWVTSNAGDAGSLMFWHYTELGRDSAAADPGRGVAWFEWGADDDDDRANPAVWRASMPALGRTISESFVATKLAELSREPERFDREYLNRWPPGMGGHDGLDLDAWAAAATPRARTVGRPVIGLDVDVHRAHTSIALAALDPAGRLVVEVVAQLPGTAGVAPYVRDLRRQRHAVAVVADDLTCASVVTELRRLRVEVTALGATDFARACGTFADHLDATPPRVLHRSQRALDVAAANAVRRRFGDAWAWSRTRSTGPVDALVACVVAAWGVWSTPAPAPPPAVTSSR